MTLRSGSRTNTETWPLSPKLTRPLADRDIVGFQRADCHRDRGDPQCDVRVAGEFFRHVHQDVSDRIARIGIEHEVEFEVVVVANACNVVALGPAHQLEPEHPVEGQGAVEIAHPNADVIDPLDGARLGHSDLLLWRTCFFGGTCAGTKTLARLAWRTIQGASQRDGKPASRPNTASKPINR
jgi:hypothetical protein